MPEQYALLVGVDRYLRGDARRSNNGQVLSLPDLTGCVNDVASLELVLRGHYKFTKITTLLSRLNAGSSLGQAENDDGSLPTFGNIKRAFERIQEEIQAGDLFYFHFSGHGAQLNTVSLSPSDGRNKDASLMTADYCKGRPAVRGWQLNRWLKRLNIQKVQVFVSLDSCYSGAAWRVFGEILGFRTPDDWPAHDNLEADEDAVQDDEVEDDEEIHPATRDAEVAVSWSLNPEAFTLIAACEANQKAAEVYSGGKPFGAFTSGLVAYLEKNKFYVSCRMIREHLQSSLRSQRPIAFGRDRLLFLGTSEPFPVHPIGFRAENGEFTIQAGRAHGIVKGTQFAPFPLQSGNAPRGVVTITIETVKKFVSTAKISQADETRLHENRGNVVIPTKWCFGETKVLQVFTDLSLAAESDFSTLLKESLGNRIVNAVTVTAKHVSAPFPHMTFRLAKKQDGRIDLFGSETVVGYPEAVRTLKIGWSSTDPKVLAAEAAAPVLHLTRFGHILGLESPRHAPFKVSFKPYSTEEEVEDEQESYETGKTFLYNFENTGVTPLYFAILNMTPEFKITQVFPSNDGTQEVKQGAVQDFCLSPKLPNGSDLPKDVEHLIHRKDRRDVFRTLVSTTPAITWKSLELPAIWNADKFHVPEGPNLRDGGVEPTEKWWFSDWKVSTTDSMYKPPSPSVPNNTPPPPPPPGPPKKKEDPSSGPSLQEQRGGGPLRVTGVPSTGPDGTTPVRQDVDKWYREQTSKTGNRIQLTLFVEALMAVQKRPLTDEKSYFRLAGIHAAPYAGWGGFDNPKDGAGRSFCVQNDYTFPTWNRVYVTLFEQVIHESMLEFIDSSQQATTEMKSEWREEASQWRLPYWDFAQFAAHDDGVLSEELRLPILATLPSVLVKEFAPGKGLVNRSNPLYRFQTEVPMGELDDQFKIDPAAKEEQGQNAGVPFGKCLSTTKYGLLDGYHADTWADGGQNWLCANRALNEHPWCQNQKGPEEMNPTLQDLTYRLLLQNPKAIWAGFSSTRHSELDKGPASWLSLEGIHNNVHNWVGGFQFKRPTGNERNGAKLWGAGHMANLHVTAFDPIFWLHQCNIDRLTAIWQTLHPRKWFNDECSSASRDNELRPFRNDQGTVFKSDDVRNWRLLNYEYAITRRGSTTAQIRDEVKELYGRKTHKLYEKCKEARGDYIIGVKYDRFALSGRPFRINVFLGPVDTDDYFDTTSPNFVGSVFNFGSDAQQQQQQAQPQETQVMSVSLLPATLAVDYAKSTLRKLSYVVVNSHGRVPDNQVKVSVKLYSAKAMFYNHAADESRGGDNYNLVVVGHPATNDDY